MRAGREQGAPAWREELNYDAVTTKASDGFMNSGLGGSAELSSLEARGQGIYTLVPMDTAGLQGGEMILDEEVPVS